MTGPETRTKELQQKDHDMTTRVLVAARLSRLATKEDTGGNRIERDDIDAKAWAERLGNRTIVAVSEDPGVSGKVDPFKRPGLGPWLTMPHLVAQYDEIVASSIDRLSRKTRDLRTLQNWAEDNGKSIRIISPSLHWPAPDDDSQGYMWDILGRLGESELKQTTKRYSAQRTYLAQRGSFIGRAPWGFMITGARGNKTLQPDPATSTPLREAISRAIRGDTLLSICRWLDSEGVLPAHATHPTARQTQARYQKGGSPTRWHPKSLRQILRSTSLKGKYITTVAGKRYTLTHEGLISAADWSRLQIALDERPKRRGPVVNKSTFLTGVAVCGLCGSPMYRMISKRTRKSDGHVTMYEFYRCHGNDKAPSQCSNNVRREELEDTVSAWFTYGHDPDDFGVLPNIYSKVVEQLLDHVVGAPRKRDGLFAHIELVRTVVVPGNTHDEETAEVEEQLRQLDFDAPDFATQQAGLLAERARLRALPVEPATVTVEKVGKTVGDIWPLLSDEARRRFLSNAGIKVRVFPKAKTDGSKLAIVFEGINIKDTIELLEKLEDI